MTTIIILLAIYILSFVRMYFWTKNAFGKDGIFSHKDASLWDFCICIVPIINTLASVHCTMFSLTGKRKSSFNLNKFFGINSTPSGELRNELCDRNIEILTFLEKNK